MNIALEYILNRPRVIPTLDILKVYEAGYCCLDYISVLHKIRRAKLILRGSGFKNFANDSYRQVYELGDRVYKLWRKDYSDKLNIVGAIKAGFYNQDTTPALLGLIIDINNDCYGYVMYKCNLYVQSRDFNKFIDVLINNTQKSNYVYDDCIPQNCGMYNGQITLLDLESSSPLSERSITICKNLPYRNALENLIK